jgi:NhaC family Na+:H+ antiporter
MTVKHTEKKERPIPLMVSLLPILFLIGVLLLIIVTYKQEAHIALVSATAFAALIAALYGYSWTSILKGMEKGISLAMGAMLILMVVGMMIGTWIMGGVVPTLIYYGLQILAPGFFLVATVLICSVVSLGTGSSWSTAGTVGVALIAIGQGLNIPLGMVGGAIISGAYFGDKMSPLSDTTNLAPAVAGTDVFTHVRHMLYTTGPSYLISLVLFAIIGSRFGSGHLETAKIDLIQNTLKAHFVLSPWLLLAPILVIVMVVRKVPPLPALFVGTILGGLAAVFVQSKGMADVLFACHSGYLSKTGTAMVDDLLTRGGMLSMMSTVALIVGALSFGGVMERAGMLSNIAAALVRRVKTTGSLVAVTVFSCTTMNVIAADQYMAIVIPGRMYKKAFEKMGLHPKNLSRCLEDSATLTSPLIPWNSCGAFMFATLGVNPLVYLPFAFLNLLNPLISIFLGYTGWTMHKLVPAQEATGVADDE